MPAPSLISYAKESGKSLEETERLWNKAKDLAKDAKLRSGRIVPYNESEWIDEDWAYCTGIFKRMIRSNSDRCQIAKEIASDIKQKECRIEDTRCKIATGIAGKIVEKECSMIEVNWDTTKTDIPIFDMSIVYADDPKKHYNCELKWLTPDEFLEWQCKTKGATKEMFLRGVMEGTVNSIIEGIKKGNMFNAFVLEFDESGKLERFQEGRHRIIAMERLGIERVPVYFCTKIY